MDEQFKQFVAELIPDLARLDPLLSHLTPSECTFRIHRDIRFGPDKSPYKTWMAAVFSLSGKNGSRPGYYLQINADGTMFVGGGLYMLDSKLL